MQVLRYIFVSFRPKEWAINLLIFVPLLFSGLFSDFQSVFQSVEAFLSFSLSAGAIYLLNDVLDREKDRQHPEKSKRPIAAGKLNAGVALFASAILVIFSLWLALRINLKFTAFFASFVALDLIYSLWLEKIRGLNAGFVALTYALRVYAGGAAINFSLSIWYFIISFLWGLFHFYYKKKRERP